MLNERDAGGARPQLANFRPDDASLPAPSIDRYRTTPPNRGLPSAASSRLTLLALRDGRMYLVTDYWVDKGKLDYTTGGALHAVPLDALDTPLTRQLNAERGVPFILAAKTR